MLYNDIIITGRRAIAKSYAKINLSLDVLGKLENGYHEVEMVMQSLTLFDLIIVDRQKYDIQIKTNCSFLPNDNRNIAFKAAEVFFEKTGIKGGAKILIHKNIPVSAGLAGGSGNAAAVLCALNLLYNAKLTDNELLSIGLELGADVPYCIMGGTKLAKGIGEVITEIAPLKKVPVLLVKPYEGISTGEIYKAIDSEKNILHPDTRAVIEAIEAGNIEKLCASMGNIMEPVTSARVPDISHIKDKMLSFGAMGSIMSGSGPTVFGIFPDVESAKHAHDYFIRKYQQVYLTSTLS
ncbi:MAG: 4-(cytidine 5'-diphospho)-2-C-methyl-D-erythritol kinase [Ruminococcaceae bacterium]|nr:4-(cytidine 5'-diphospho)-2-C-methyl-D-erythritol kinase [Oscillospiraceae bacterium]